MSKKTTPTCNCLQHLLPLDSQEKPVRLSRRKLLSAGLMAGMAGGLGIVSPSPAHAQTTLTPEQALEKLRQGNERFARRAITSFQEDLDILQRRTAGKQEPFAAVLACADSRMPVELVFDQSIGKLFVARVAGNIATPAIIASLEYRDTGHQGTGRPGPRRLRRDQGRGRERRRARADQRAVSLYPSGDQRQLVHRYHRNGAAERHQPGAAAALGLARPGKTVRRRRVADPAGALRRRRWTGQLALSAASSMLAGRTGGGHLLLRNRAGLVSPA